jgi:alpha-tubulin suppressor-like RCC1 family protein
MGTLFACALRDDGSVRCWGENTDGQLGNGTRSRRACDGAACFSASATPVVGLDRVVRVSAGGDAACALRADGTAWCWGNNANGQLGDGTRTRRKAPVQVRGLRAVMDIATSGQYTCAIDQSDVVWGWGWPGGDTSPVSTTPVAFRAPK